MAAAGGILQHLTVRCYCFVMEPSSALIKQMGQSIGANKPAYVLVADGLRNMIVSGQLAAGDKLPDESHLADLFMVGRSTIREAIRVLGAENLVSVSRGAGGGIFVTHPRLDQVSERLSNGLELLIGSDECPVDEVIEARVVLESFAVRRAATRRTPESMAAIRAALEDEARQPLDLADMFQLNIRFHIAILEAAGNSVVRALAEPVFSSWGRKVSGPGSNLEWWDRVTAEHRLIADAIFEGDAVRAEEFVVAHLECLIDFYSDPEESPTRVNASATARSAGRGSAR